MMGTSIMGRVASLQYSGQNYRCTSLVAGAKSSSRYYCRVEGEVGGSGMEVEDDDMVTCTL